MRRRRLAAALALAGVFAAVLLVLLRSDAEPERPVSALDDALGYLEVDAPLVAAVDTDPEGEQAQTLGTLLGRVPVALPALEQLLERVQLRELSMNGELRRQLGDPLVIGLRRPVSSPGGVGAALVAAMRVRNPSRVKRLLLRRPSLLPRAKAHGVRIYEPRTPGQGLTVAVDGRVLVAGASRSAVADALGNRRSPERLREADFEQAVEGVPQDAAVRVAARPQPLLGAVPALRGVLRLKWPAAVDSAAMAFKAHDDGLSLDFRLHTDPNRLTEADLPLAPRAGPMPLLGKPEEVSVALLEPARVVRFGAAVARALDPARAERVDAVVARLRTRGVDLDRDFTARLGATASVAVDPVTRRWAARVAVRRVAAFKASLREVADSLPELATALGIGGVGVAAPAEGESFYALARPRGQPVVFGVLGPSLVAASEPRRAASLLSEPTRIEPAAKGSLVAAVDAQKLAIRLIAPRLSGLASLGAPLALGPVGDLKGWASIDREGLTATVKLTVK